MVAAWLPMLALAQIVQTHNLHFTHDHAQKKSMRRAQLSPDSFLYTVGADSQTPPQGGLYLALPFSLIQVAGNPSPASFPIAHGWKNPVFQHH